MGRGRRKRTTKQQPQHSGERACVCVLKVYMKTWFQYHDQCTGKEEYSTDDLQCTLEYWRSVGSGAGTCSFYKWLQRLTWPHQVWTQRDEYDILKALDKLRRSFPSFRGGVRLDNGISDRHLLHLRPLVTSANLINCDSLTDLGFKHLSNMTSLDMEKCYQTTITDAAFQYLSNLKCLCMDSYRQSTITDAALQYLTNWRV